MLLLWYVSDINECTTSNGGCEHICVNGDGSYSCTCDNGYELNNNHKNCSGTFHQTYTDINHI